MANRCRRYIDVQRTIQVKAASASIQLDGDRPPPIGYSVDRSLGDGLRTRVRAYCYKNHQSLHTEWPTKIIRPSQIRLGDR